MTRTMRAQLFAATALLALAACATDDEPEAAAPSVARGLAFAQANCGGCHAVTPADGPSAASGAPSFDSLANNPAVTRMGLDVLLQSSHRNMPNFIVSPREREDLWAYLSALRDDEEI